MASLSLAVVSAVPFVWDRFLAGAGEKTKVFDNFKKASSLPLKDTSLGDVPAKSVSREGLQKDAIMASIGALAASVVGH